jgi:hypothetical protein
MFYGALVNKFFRFSDFRLGESTTGTGRMILLHQCAKTAEILDGEYAQPDIYIKDESAKSKKAKKNEKQNKALGINATSEVEEEVEHFGYSDDYSIVYGDSVAGDTIIETSAGPCTIESLFTTVDFVDGDKEYSNCSVDVQGLTYLPHEGCNGFRHIKYVMRHKVQKKMYRVHLGNTRYLDVTEDHSLMTCDSSLNIFEVTPEELILDNHPLLIRTDDGFQPLPYDLIEEIEYDDYVYDIEIAETHTFYANDILVHNTDSTYFTTHADTVNHATMIGNAVAEKINNSFQKFMQDAFVCHEGFDDLISCEREIVSDKGIFVSKKRYILHIVDLDGYKCDKMKVMGLDTKKTTLNKEISVILNDFVERLLKGETLKDIAPDVVALKERIKSSDDMMFLGLPKGVNGVEQYTIDLKKDKNARVPGHVRASIFYNQLRKKHNDLESPEIITGMKIKVYYLKKPMGKFKAIALPGDIQKVPEWFYDSQLAIDYDMHIERMVDKPLGSIIEAIGEKVPTLNSLRQQNMFEF